MGRPLNKKYFGNRNVGASSTTADDGIGGSRVGSVTISTRGAYTTRATVSFSTPDLTGVGAVQATGTVTMEASTATVVDGKSGYVVGDLLTITGGGGAIARVATVDGVTGAVLTVAFTGTGAVRGSQTNLTGITTGVATTTNSVAGVVGVTLDVVYRVKEVVITNPGSGYSTTSDAAPTFSNGVGGAGDAATGVVVLEVDTGAQGAVGNNENAITCYAFVTGGSRKVADILKQVSTNRYKVKTADGTMICQLVTDAAANAAGEMDITAVDSDGKTYYVSKLTAHRATLHRYGAAGHLFPDATSQAWSFDAASTGYVQIQNT